jgi:hypothetical protein
MNSAWVTASSAVEFAPSPKERSAAMTDSTPTDSRKNNSPYASTSPMLAVGFLALLIVLILRVMVVGA